jgi:hypothetical protein
MNKDGGSGKSSFLGFIRVFEETIKLDVWDLNFFFSDPDAFDWTMLHLVSSEWQFRKGFFPQIIIFVGRTLKRFIEIIFHTEKSTNNNVPFVFIGFTKNQVDSLRPVYEKIESNSTLIDCSKNYFWKQILSSAYVLSICFIPWAIKDFIKSSGSNRAGIAYNFSNHILTYGLYYVLRTYLKKSKFTTIILANDHNMEPRVINKAARDEGIITYYIQHASVTRVFPPLNMDFALLEGADALQHYESAGQTGTTVFLIGNPKFDSFKLKIRNSKSLENIGICVNLFDPIENVEDLIKTIKHQIPKINIYLRIHPGQSHRDKWTNLAKELSIEYSDSLTEGVFDFLLNVDAIIAGNSNVHLDAVMLDVYPIFYNFSVDDRQRYYSFLERGLCEFAENKNSVINFLSRLITEKPSIRSRAKCYCDTIGTPYDGMSSELAASLIENFPDFPKPRFNNWLIIESSSIRAYKISENPVNSDKNHFDW